MRIGIIQFPGSNCERETRLAIQRVGMTPIDCLWNEPREKLMSMDGYVIVGGFSYEDRSRAGIIAALDPVMDIIREQNRLGKPVLGICNGAQILVETGLVPGLDGPDSRVALTHNKRMSQGHVLGTGFYNAWVHLRLNEASCANIFTNHLKSNSPLHIPIAHGEGRFIIPSELLERMKAKGLIVFQYSDSEGNIQDEFPVNPNGSTDNIAAICNPAGTVLAMMPHPERTPNGDAIFLSMKEMSSRAQQATSNQIAPGQAMEILRYTRDDGHEFIVDQVITDNQAFTVENTLKRLGIPVSIKRQTHWKIQCASKSIAHQVAASGILYNTQKEFIVESPKNSKQRSFLVRSKEDCVGLQKKQQAIQQLDDKGIQSIQRGVLWHIQSESDVLDNVVQRVLETGILFNPISEVCYEYA